MKYTVEMLMGYGCTQAEAKVVELLLLGKNNKEISEALFISPKTSKFHCTKVYSKFGVKSRSQLMYKFYSELVPARYSEMNTKSQAV